MFQQIVAFVHRHEPGTTRARLATELVSLPLSEVEEQWLSDYLLHGDGQELYGAADTMIMRQIAMGRTADAARLANSAQTTKVNGLDWKILTDNLQI